MKLIELTMVNFRQFFGEQTLEFAHSDAARNITLIHGYNGSGKTALLNAFVWGLYGRTTPDLEAPDRLANEKALGDAGDNTPVQVKVRLRFRARGEIYIAERTATARRKDGGEVEQTESTLTLRRIASSGESETLEGAQNRVDRLLPPDLYPFFFFNGERVEELASPQAYDRVEQGIKTLLNVLIFERGTRDLRKKVYGDLGKELQRYGDSEAQQAIEEGNRLREREAEIMERRDILQKNEAELVTEVELIEARQREVAAIAGLVAERDRATRSRSEVEVRIQELRLDAARRLSKDGYLAFAEPVFARTADLVSAARQRGDLPAKVKPQFVDDLLESRECVCGRGIEDGSPEHGRLLKWRSNTGLAELEEAISQTHGNLGMLRNRRSTFFEEIGRVQAAMSDAMAAKRRLGDEIDQLNAKIGDPGTSYDAAELEQKRGALGKRLEDVRFELRTMKRDLETLGEELRALEQRIEKLKLHDEKAKLVQHQMHVVGRIADALEQIYMIQKQDVREELARSVEEIWNDAAVKDYRASVSDDFRLELFKTVAGTLQPVHGASTGEKQVLSLSFVGSLVRKARKNEERNEEEEKLGGRDLLTGGEYPLVMDSPFGSLEDDYRRKVAEWIPKLAAQLVVMVSKTQWRNEVEESVRPRIGREYILELQTPKGDADRTIDIAGREYPYVRTSSDDAERTLIREVK